MEKLETNSETIFYIPIPFMLMNVTVLKEISHLRNSIQNFIFNKQFNYIKNESYVPLVNFN